jgi:hypothetical protein
MPVLRRDVRAASTSATEMMKRFCVWESVRVQLGSRNRNGRAWNTHADAHGFQRLHRFLDPSIVCLELNMPLSDLYRLVARKDMQESTDCTLCHLPAPLRFASAACLFVREEARGQVNSTIDEPERCAVDVRLVMLRQLEASK